MVHRVDLSEPEQELLEALWEHEVEGRPLSPDRAAETVTLGLVEKGWTVSGAHLSDPGRALARGAIRRHRLAERLAADVLGADRDWQEGDACRLEHSLVDGLDDKVCTFLGHPRVCPHGHSIPEGECCRAAALTVGPAITPLAQLSEGESAVVAYLAAPGGRDLQKFLSMGIHPGDRLTLVRTTPAIVFRCGHSQFAIDRVLADQVWVRR
jgi:DtxR family transcriptional regulator, Mn-dependent transcriptional regulator